MPNPTTAVLSVAEIGERTNIGPPEELIWITEINVYGQLRDFEQYIRLLHRCPNVTSISCRRRTCDMPTRLSVEGTVVPKLLKFRGDLLLARQFIPRRRVEDICIDGDGELHASSWPTTRLRYFAPYSKTVRTLELKPVLWHDGCIGEIAQIFRNLESLTLEIDDLPDQDWLEDNLIATLALFPDLHTIHLLPARESLCGSWTTGPPPEAELEAQRPTLEAARLLHPSLIAVSFDADVLWSADPGGLWSATHTNIMGNKVLLYSHLDYLPPPPTPKLPTSKAGSALAGSPRGLPLELLFQIAGALRTSEQYGDESDSQTDLKSLSLASRAMRAVYQPLLFDRLALSDTLRANLFRLSKLERMFNDRTESPGWVRTLKLTWLRPPSAELEAMALHKELVKTMSRVFLKFSELRDIEISEANLTTTMLSHLHRIPTLYRLRIADCLVNSASSPTIGEHAESSAIAGLQLEICVNGAHFGINLNVLKLANSPAICSLSMDYIGPKVAKQLIQSAPNGLQNLTTLCIAQALGPLEPLLSMLALCPNIISLSLPSYASERNAMPSTVHPELVSRLTHVKTALDVVKLFVPGRPVRRMIVEQAFGSPSTWSEDTISPLASGSLAVEDLMLEGFTWVPGGIGIISRLFSDLVALRIDFNGVQPEALDWLSDVLLDLVRTCRKLTIIQNLTADFDESRPDPDLHEEENKVRQGRAIASELRTVMFRPGRAWKVRGDGNWVHYYVRDTLERGRLGDWDPM